MSSDIIKLYFNQGVAYVWNAQDWLTLRKEYRIIGHLRGTVASFPKQDSIPGLPLALLPEEVSLLVKRGISKLVKRKNLDAAPSEEVQQAYQDLREKLYQEQVILLKDLRKKEIEATLDKIIEGKRRKQSTSSEDFNEDQFNKDIQMQVEIDKIMPVQKQHTLVQIFTEYPLKSEDEEIPINFLENYCPLKEKIYEDLWNKGNYVTSGEKFGGDFLIYPGDPMLFHSSHIVSVVPSMQTKHSMSDIVINGRVAVNVKKIAVYATQDSNGEILYQTLKWKGL